MEAYPQGNCLEVRDDATQTVGYFIRWHGRSFFLMTDAGRVTEEAVGYASRADAVVIGAGSGLSAAAGFTYNGDRFLKYFGDFAKKYGISDMYSAVSGL